MLLWQSSVIEFIMFFVILFWSKPKLNLYKHALLYNELVKLRYWIKNIVFFFKEET